MTKVAAIQMNSSENIADNLKQAELLISQAVEQGAKLVVLPEMFAMMGSDQNNATLIMEKLGEGIIQDFLKQQAQAKKIWIVGGTIPTVVNLQKYNATALLISPEGKIVNHYDKIHLFDVEISDAEQYLESKTTEAGNKIMVHDTPFGRLGIAVCYDIRFPELFRKMIEQQVEIIAVPAAFTTKTGAAHWEILLRARAIENQLFIIAAGQTGIHSAKRETYGHSMIIDPWGKILAELPKNLGVVVADIDLNYLQEIRRKMPIFSHRKM